MKSEVFQIVLEGRNCSGRGVRMRAAGPREVAAAKLSAAKMVSKDAGPFEYGLAVNERMLQETVIAVSKKGDQTSATISNAPEDWEKVTPRTWEIEPEVIDSYFTGRDMAVLMQIVSQLYNVGEDEVSAIMGEALTVSVD